MRRNGEIHNLIMKHFVHKNVAWRRERWTSILKPCPSQHLSSPISTAHRQDLESIDAQVIEYLRMSEELLAPWLHEYHSIVGRHLLGCNLYYSASLTIRNSFLRTRPSKLYHHVKLVVLLFMQLTRDCLGIWAYGSGICNWYLVFGRTTSLIILFVMLNCTVRLSECMSLK